MFGLGMQELIVILVIVVVLFGATRLPELGKGIGQAIKNFRKGMSEPDEIDVTPKKDKPKKEELDQKEEEKKEEAKKESA
jgi:sec-independent protein translocase protein TatA